MAIIKIENISNRIQVSRNGAVIESYDSSKLSIQLNGNGYVTTKSHILKEVFYEPLANYRGDLDQSFATQTDFTDYLAVIAGFRSFTGFEPNKEVVFFGISLVDQEPTATGLAGVIPVAFDTVLFQNTSAVSYNPITKELGFLSDMIDIIASADFNVSRDNNPSVSVIVGRALLDGVQQANSLISRSANSDIFNTLLTVSSYDVVTNEKLLYQIALNGGSVVNGGLKFTPLVDLAGWNPAPSASLMIQADLQ